MHINCINEVFLLSVSEQRPLKGYNCLSKVIALFSGRTRNKTQIFGISGDFRLESVS